MIVAEVTIIPKWHRQFERDRFVLLFIRPYIIIHN